MFMLYFYVSFFKETLDNYALILYIQIQTDSLLFNVSKT